MMLSNEYYHSLDDKNRVSVPADMRAELGENFIIVRSLRGTCLRFYSAAAWEEYIKPLKAMQRKDSEKIFWYLYRDAITATPDSLGRVRLTKELLDFAEVMPNEKGSRSLVIVGCGDFGEIWSEELYCKHVEELNLDDIRRALEESGL